MVMILNRSISRVIVTCVLYSCRSHMLGCAADCGTCALIDPAVRCHPLVLGIDPFDFELLPGIVIRLSVIYTL